MPSHCHPRIVEYMQQAIVFGCSPHSFSTSRKGSTHSKLLCRLFHKHPPCESTRLLHDPLVTPGCLIGTRRVPYLFHRFRPCHVQPILVLSFHYIPIPSSSLFISSLLLFSGAHARVDLYYPSITSPLKQHRLRRTRIAYQLR